MGLKPRQPTRERPFGFIDLSGRLTFESYEDAKPFSDALAWIQLDGRWGAIDTRRELVIPPRFDRVEPFAEGLAPAGLPGAAMGYVNREGEWVIAPEYDFALPFAAGYGVVVKGGAIPAYARAFASLPEGGKWGAVDRDGNVIAAPRYAYVQSADGFLLLNEGGRHTGWGIVTGGRWAYWNPQTDARFGGFREATVFGSGHAIISTGTRYDIIDTTGTVTASCACRGRPSEFRDERAIFMLPGSGITRSKFCYIDTTGAVVVNDLGQARPFYDRVAAVNVGGELDRGETRGGTWCFVDTSGERFGEGPWKDADRFSCGRGLVWTSASAVGFIDRSGELVISPRGWARAFSHDLAVVRVADWR